MVAEIKACPFQAIFSQMKAVSPILHLGALGKFKDDLNVHIVLF
jgi:hypothetical protein